jgi:hypothetical protein
VTFKFPKELLTLARSILYKRYVDFIGKVDEFNVEWTEQYDEGDPKPCIFGQRGDESTAHLRRRK